MEYIFETEHLKIRKFVNSQEMIIQIGKIVVE